MFLYAKVIYRLRHVKSSETNIFVCIINYIQWIELLLQLNAILLRPKQWSHCDILSPSVGNCFSNQPRCCRKPQQRWAAILLCVVVIWWLLRVCMYVFLINVWLFFFSQSSHSNVSAQLKAEFVFVYLIFIILKFKIYLFTL